MREGLSIILIELNTLYAYYLYLYYFCGRLKRSLNGSDTLVTLDPHVALQVGHGAGELRLRRLGQLGVQAAAGAPPPVLLVLVLEQTGSV